MAHFDGMRGILRLQGEKSNFSLFSCNKGGVAVDTPRVTSNKAPHDDTPRPSSSRARDPIKLRPDAPAVPPQALPSEFPPKNPLHGPVRRSLAAPEPGDRVLQWISAARLGQPKSPRKFALWGELPPAPRLAVVGSRAALRKHEATALWILQEAKTQGWSLVSGGALGIDAYAHRAALQLRLSQLAVLPCPPEQVYPPDHSELFAAIAGEKNSGILYALAPGQGMRRQVFIGRNRMILDLAQALLVMEAQLASGSWSTGTLALKRGMKVAVLGGSPGNLALNSRGAALLDTRNKEEVRRGVCAWLRDEFEPHLDPLSPTSRPSGPASPASPFGPSWPADLEPILRQMTGKAQPEMGIDDFEDPLLAMIGLGRALAQGWVVEIAPGRYRLGPGPSCPL